MHCENLSKFYGETAAIDDLSVTSVTSFLGLLGPNGSGKSTLIKLLLNLIQSDRGVANLGTAKENIRVVPDFPALPEHLTISQWMEHLETFYGPLPPNIDLELEFRLNGTWKIKELSVGQKRLVAIMPIFFGNPRLIILDEPTNFLDIVLRKKVLNMIKNQIARTDTKVLIASHRIDEIELLASEVIILNEGKLVSKHNLKLDYRLGYDIRVNKLDAFVTYLENYEVKHNIADTLLGKVVHIKKFTDGLMSSISDFNRDGGFIFEIAAVNSLQDRLDAM